MKIQKKTAHVMMSALLMSLLLVACTDQPDAQSLLKSAKDYLAKNDSKAAVIQIKNALQSNPDLPEARYLLGTALLQNGDPAGAETELRKALDLKYEQDSVVPQLAKALLAQGQAKKLTDELASIELSQGGAKASLQMALTSAYAMQGKTDLSQSALNAALLAQPGLAEALLVQARQKATQRDFEGALVLTDEVLAKAPTYPDAWKLKGDLFLYAKNQPTEALAAYRQAVNLQADFLPAHAAILTILMQQGQLAEADQQLLQINKFAANHPQTKFLAAQLAFQKKDFKRAHELSQQVLAATPNSLMGLQLAGVVALQLNDLSQAQEHLGRAVQAAPQLRLARRALVLAYLRSGQTAKALETLQPGLNQENVDPELLSIAGEVYLQTGDLKQAQTYLSQAAQLVPKDAKKQTALALTHFMSGATDTAFEELHTIASSDTGTTADLALISTYLKRASFDQALKAIDALEKKQPDKPLAAQLRGRTLIFKNDLAGARKSFEKALALDSDYFSATASLAGLDLLEKKPLDAKKRLEAVLVKNPNHSQALLALAEYAAQSGEPKEEVARLIGRAVAANPTNARLHLLLIDFYLRQQEVKAAFSAAQNAVSVLPDSPELLDALGRTQQASGDANQAIASFHKLAAMQPRSALPQMRLAQVYLNDKNKEAGVASLRKGLELQPDLLEAQRALIVIDLADKRVSPALAMARTVQKQRPGESVGYALEGDIEASQKNWTGAAGAYRSGLKLQPASELAMKLHSVLGVSGQTAEAEKWAANWQKDHPQDASFLFYLGDLALTRKDYQAAEKCYAAVVKLQVNNALAYNNLAWVSARLNKPDARLYAEKAIALVPDQPAFMDTLAMLLSEQGDYAKAIALQNKALTLQPANNLFKLNRAKIYIKGNQKELALKELEGLRQLGDKFSGQAEVAVLLKNL